MSNLSTLPKGDSAWLLRKAIERIIDQVSVLETNIGVSTSGNSADTQIIFNDAGTLRGDAGLTYNKTLDGLTVAGLVTAGSATITGDLTVDTSTLKVDSTNNRVGIGTATPSNGLQVQGAGQSTVTPTVTGDQSALSLIDSGFAANNGGMLTFGSNVSNGYIGQVAIKSLLVNGAQNGTSDLAFFTRGAISDSTLAERYRIAVNGVATWSNVGGVAGTAMTLNSTGLGIGAVPSNYRLYVSAAFASGLNGAYIESGEFNKKSLVVNHTNSGVAVNLFEVQKVGTAQFLVDSSGNVGIGVTPSAWSSGYTALQNRKTSWFSSNARDLNLGANVYVDAGGYKYIDASQASLYTSYQGAHTWYTAAAGAAANDPITTFASAKMTLDVNGNLILLSSATPATLATNGQLTVNATSNTNLRFSYRGSDGTTRVANITLA